MTAELIALTDELRATNGTLATVVGRLDEADRRAREERKRAGRHRASTVVLAVVVAAVVLLGWRDAREGEGERHRDCMQTNALRADIRAAIVDTVLVIIEGADEPERLTPLVERIQDRLATTIPDQAC